MMEHLDDDTLALIAMAELEPAEHEREHLASCPTCSGSLAELRQTADLGRAARTVELLEPADVVWGNIHASLDLSPQVAAVPRMADFVTDADAQSGASERDADTSADTAAPAPVTSITDARSGRRNVGWWPIAAAAAVVGLVGGVAAGVWWQSTQEDSAAVVAEAELDPFPGWDATGAARVEERADGSRVVVVDLDTTADDTEFREVWLIKSDASGLVSIGLLDGTSGSFVVPQGLDLAEYPLVDVSAEPDNGDPAHSGDSIVRGELRSS
ncbi:anti-sigma factor [Diaminobutyricimonas sp. TR449]|uniref:anti-sigma factor n=1 Tax=Diaminobutyricimonas sp. TR449 TaxID=2708076 RepID=UPI00142395B8|nr:anti-sigma factor [Diaminobutyricimonas sp. TR449]